LANPILSLIEDGVSFVLFVLAVLVPLVVVGLLALALLLITRRLRHLSTVTAA
jgi:hypothetical protein